MNIIQLQPGDIFEVTGLHNLAHVKALTTGLKRITPCGVSIMVTTAEHPVTLLRAPDKDATAAYLAARKAEALDGTDPKEGGHSCPTGTTRQPDITAEQLVDSLERIAHDFDCPLDDVTQRFNRLSPEFTDAPELLLRATRLALRDHFRQSRIQADATAILIQHRLPDGSPIPSHDIRTAIMEAELTAGDDGTSFHEALGDVIRHRGYLPPETLDLTDSELDSELVELAIGLPVTIDILREQAARVGRLTSTPVTNRERLATVRALLGLSTDR